MSTYLEKELENLEFDLNMKKKGKINKFYIERTKKISLFLIAILTVSLAVLLTANENTAVNPHEMQWKCRKCGTITWYDQIKFCQYCGTPRQLNLQWLAQDVIDDEEMLIISYPDGNYKIGYRYDGHWCDGVNEITETITKDCQFAKIEEIKNTIDGL